FQVRKHSPESIADQGKIAKITVLPFAPRSRSRRENRLDVAGRRVQQLRHCDALRSTFDDKQCVFRERIGRKAAFVESSPELVDALEPSIEADDIGRQPAVSEISDRGRVRFKHRARYIHSANGQWAVWCETQVIFDCPPLHAQSAENRY